MSAVLLSAAVALPALANEKPPGEKKLETLIVTAQKRKENIQDVPVSITALSEIQIEDAGITGIKDLSFYTPNLFFVTSGNRSEMTPIIRGMYNRMNPNPTVGMFVDGVSYSRHLAYDPDFFDIERIEVLRGPQGTLFGRNTEAGAINIVTKKPGNEFEAKLSAGRSSFSTQAYYAGLKAPLINDRLFLGVSGKLNKSDGYITNDVTGNDEVEFKDDKSGRARLRWTPSQRLDVLFTAEVTDNLNGTGCFSPFKHLSRHVNANFDGTVDNTSNGQALNIDYEGDGVRVTSITAVRNADMVNHFDMDMSPMDMMRLKYTQDHNQLTQEIRFASPDDGRAFKWLVGGFYMNEDFDLILENAFPMGFSQIGIPPHLLNLYSNLNTVNYAAFGQATYTLWDKLDLTLGLRYDYDEKEFEGIRRTTPDWSGNGSGVVKDTKTNSVWLPKAAVSYRFTKRIMGYAGISRGYTAGAWNDLDDSSGVHGVPYDAEYSWNYETGFKTAFFNNKLILNTSLFFVDWTDKQVFFAKGQVGNVFKNAAEATSRGIEIDALIRPARGLEIIGGFGYIDATYDSFNAPVFNAAGVQTGTKSYEGNKLEMAPEISYNLAVQYRYPLPGSGVLFTRAELQGVGSFYDDLANQNKHESYQLVNARIGYETSLGKHDFSIYLWAKNIFDQAYATSGYESPVGYLGRLGEPRTIGVDFIYRF